MAIRKVAGLFIGRDYIAPPREARKRGCAFMPLRGMRPRGRGAIQSRPTKRPDPDEWQPQSVTEDDGLSSWNARFAQASERSPLRSARHGRGRHRGLAPSVPGSGRPSGERQEIGAVRGAGARGPDFLPRAGRGWRRFAAVCDGVAENRRCARAERTWRRFSATPSRAAAIFCHPPPLPRLAVAQNRGHVRVRRSKVAALSF